MEDAVLLTPDNHPDKPSYLKNLGQSLSTRFKKFNDLSDLYAAVSTYYAAAMSNIGSSYTRFQAAERWMQLALQYLPCQNMESSRVCMSLVPQLTWLGSSIRDRHHRVTHAGQIARDAASIAIKANKCDTAVEWLEQGRSVVWSQMMQLRSPLDELHQANPKLAESLQSLSTLLEGATSHSILLDDTSQRPLQVDYHKLAHEREQLLKQIRRLPGFERFLLPKTLSQLLPAANQGPTVMLNVSKLQCDALVLVPGVDHILHVPLDSLSFETARAWHELFQLAINKDSISIADFHSRLKALRPPDRPDMVASSESVLAYILEELWSHVVHPILNALAITVSFSFSCFNSNSFDRGQ